MAIIAKITTQKKATDRYNVFLDYGKGEEYAFSVDEDVLIKFQLKKGMELDEFSLQEINYQDDIRKSYNMAIRFLARRMRSELEVRDHLEEKEVDAPIIQEVIHKLYANQFLNDGDFANAFVRTQINTTDKGPELIIRELRDKGINEAIIERVLSQFSEENQLEKAQKMAEKLFQKNARDSIRIQRQKVEQLLLRKGYPFAVIAIAVETAQGKNDGDDEMEAIRYQGKKIQRKFSHLDEFEYRNKVKQVLYRKGFSLEEIEQFLKEEVEE